MKHPNDQLHETEARWFAIRTRSKCEKYVQNLLENKAVHVYLPLQTSTRQYLRKIKTYHKPLITCYVFVKIIKDQYLSVLETEHVAGYVRTGKQLIAIPEEEIHKLRIITLEDGLNIEAVAGAFAQGDRVEIVAGNLVGLKGTVIRHENGKRLQVELETLGYSILIDLDAALLAKMKGA